MKTFKKSDIKVLLQNLAFEYLKNDYVIANTNDFEFRLTTKKDYDKDFNGFDDIYICFKRENKGSIFDDDIFKIRVFTNNKWNQEKREYEHKTLYESPMFYVLDTHQRIFTNDVETFEQAKQKRKQKWDKRFEENKKPTKTWTINDRVLNAKLLTKIENKFGKKLKDQKLTFNKVAYCDGTKGYHVLFNYRNKPHFITLY